MNVERTDWPALPEVVKDEPQKGVKEALYQAKLDAIKADRNAAIEVEKASVAADIEREKAGWASEYVQAQAFYNAYIEVAKEQIDRSTARAEFVQKAAGAVGAAYTAVLALSFALGQTGTNPLPGRGIIPTIFLGLSIVERE